MSADLRLPSEDLRDAFEEPKPVIPLGTLIDVASSSPSNTICCCPTPAALSDICPICTDSMDEIVTTNCGHTFHLECGWRSIILSGDRCPLCRQCPYPVLGLDSFGDDLGLDGDVPPWGRRSPALLPKRGGGYVVGTVAQSLDLLSGYWKMVEKGDADGWWLVKSGLMKLEEDVALKPEKDYIPQSVETDALSRWSGLFC